MRGDDWDRPASQPAGRRRASSGAAFALVCLLARSCLPVSRAARRRLAHGHHLSGILTSGGGQHVSPTAAAGSSRVVCLERRRDGESRAELPFGVWLMFGLNVMTILALAFLAGGAQGAAVAAGVWCLLARWPRTLATALMKGGAERIRSAQHTTTLM
jgi:hypothetical protein